jgi:hypothetical protein
MNVNLNGRDHLNDLGVDGRVILKWALKDKGRRVRTGFIELRIGSSGGLMRTR